MDPEVIRAAASSPLGILALMVLVLSSLALAFFKDADPKIRLCVFVLLFAGAAAFAAAVLVQKPKPTPVPIPVPVPTPKCRLKANGVEQWGKTENVTADSDWRGGGSSPSEYCGGELAARRALLGDNGVVELSNSTEESKDINPPWNVRRYRYTCTFTQRTEPVYKLAASPDCPS